MFETHLTDALVTALQHVKHQLGDERISRLALDVQPWSGFLEGAILTASEVRADPALLDPAEMAAWRWYAFTEKDSTWQRDTASWRADMRAAYDTAADRRAAAREVFLACARSLASDAVRQALGAFSLADDFACSVTDPDSGEEFVSLSGS
ncbi:MAG: hypothetical protein H6738_02870 [Alphaproteobacteria bacterium]|nr:hypothetical protein [Alphaproteobacteria bacterium]MCB9695713.1 hypothetical protein [Alphaproteobacteria bacterium]